MKRIFIGAAFLSTIVLFVATDTNAKLDEGLVFYLTFDTLKRQTFVDKSGNGLNAVIHPNTEHVKGKYRKAIQIKSAAMDCINIPSEEKLKVPGEITIMAWIYYQEAWAGKKVHWFDKNCHSFAERGGSYGIGSFDIGNGPQIWLFLGAGADQGNEDRKQLVVPHEMMEEKWYHVAGSYDQSTMKIYLDGQLIGERSEEFDFVGDNESGLRIGCAKNKPQYSFVNGYIDEAAIWNRALSPDDITKAMRGDFLAVSPSGKVSTSWAAIKERLNVKQKKEADYEKSQISKQRRNKASFRVL